MSESETKRETWTQEMDDVLVDAFLHQQNDEKKVGGSFTSEDYEAIIKELQQKFGRPFEKEKVKSHSKLVKRCFSKCFDLFKNGLSRFAWDPITKQWCAEPEVWQKLIEVKPESKEWMGKPIHNYDKLMIVCGGDRATGQHSETAKDIRNKRSLPGESESTETIEVTSESAQEVDNENEVTSPEVQEIRSQEFKSKKARRSKDEEVDGIKVALHDIAGALREGNAVYEKVKQKQPIPEAEIWKLLEDLKIERQVFIRAYLYLIDNPERTRAVIGCPLEKRKELLLEMVLGPVGPSR